MQVVVRDFMLFRRMLAPILVQVAFWVVVAFCLVTAIVDFFHRDIIYGLEVLILGPIVIRIICEIAILFFRMNETLTDIRDSLLDKPKQ